MDGDREVRDLVEWLENLAQTGQDLVVKDCFLALLGYISWQQPRVLRHCVKVNFETTEERLDNADVLGVCVELKST